MALAAGLDAVQLVAGQQVVGGDGDGVGDGVEIAGRPTEPDPVADGDEVGVTDRVGQRVPQLGEAASGRWGDRPRPR